ncbi:MAG TPA: hypothetical protein VG838_02740 [Opitutaceae bacterium]|nr:hypothetical protein [Opitutaceae bacterium]
MSPHPFRPVFLSLLALALAAPLSAAVARPKQHAVESDLVPSEERQGVLDLASRLSHPSEPAPVGAGLKTPFDFDKAEPDPTPPPSNGGPPQPAQSKGAREILETLAPLIRPTGTLIMSGRPPILNFGRTNVKVGGKLTINFEGNDYDLELVAVTSTSFTLRYKDEETTRPIKSK